MYLDLGSEFGHRSLTQSFIHRGFSGHSKSKLPLDAYKAHDDLAPVNRSGLVSYNFSQCSLSFVSIKHAKYIPASEPL